VMSCSSGIPPAVEAPPSLLLLLLLHCHVSWRIRRAVREYLTVCCCRICLNNPCERNEALRELLGHLHLTSCMLLCICGRSAETRTCDRNLITHNSWRREEGSSRASKPISDDVPSRLCESSVSHVATRVQGPVLAHSNRLRHLILCEKKQNLNLDQFQTAAHLPRLNKSKVCAQPGVGVATGRAAAEARDSSTTGDT
jgi:hypothetical protein